MCAIEHGVPVITIERGSIAVADGHSFMELATAKARDFAAATGDTPMSANGKLKFFTTWLARSIVSAEAAGVGPKGADVLPFRKDPSPDHRAAE